MSQENVEIVRHFWAALNEDPPRLLLEVLDDEAEITNPSEFPLQGPFRGHEGARIWFRESWEVFTGLHHELEEVIDVGEGATVISVQRIQGRTRHMSRDQPAVGSGLDIQSRKGLAGTGIYASARSPRSRRAVGVGPRSLGLVEECPRGPLLKTATVPSPPPARDAPQSVKLAYQSRQPSNQLRTSNSIV